MLRRLGNGFTERLGKHGRLMDNSAAVAAEIHPV
jgi:hypothetical protein